MERRSMEERITRCMAEKLAKKTFLEALKSNDYKTMEDLLLEKQIDVDTVFEVEDENLILASYKQGKTVAAIAFAKHETNRFW